MSTKEERAHNAAKMRRWRAANRERDLSNQRALRAKDPEKERARGRNWRRAHPEVAKAWADKNPERVKALGRKHKKKWWDSLSPELQLKTVPRDAGIQEA